MVKARPAAGWFVGLVGSVTDCERHNGEERHAGAAVGFDIETGAVPGVGVRAEVGTQELRPDGLLLVSHSGRIEEVTFSGSLIRALGLTRWLTAAGGRVYFGTLSDDGLFFVLNLKDGALVQKLELDGAVIGSPAISDGRLVVGTESGTVYCLGRK